MTKTMPSWPVAASARAASGTMLWPFHGATRPGTSTMRAWLGTRQAPRSASLRCGSTASGSNMAVSISRGMMVI